MRNVEFIYIIEQEKLIKNAFFKNLPHHHPHGMLRLLEVY